MIRRLWNLLRNLPLPAPSVAPVATEHDYTRPCWGHDFHIVNAAKGRWMGWGLGLKVGDVLRVRMVHGGVGRFRIKTLEYKRDPRDLWTANVALVDIGEAPPAPLRPPRPPPPPPDDAA